MRLLACLCAVVKGRRKIGLSLGWRSRANRSRQARSAGLGVGMGKGVVDARTIWSPSLLTVLGTGHLSVCTECTS